RLKSYCHTAGNLNRIKIGMGFSGRLQNIQLAKLFFQLIPNNTNKKESLNSSLFVIYKTN
ncbi:hypothetical protein, partial [Acinetobacter junii]|uniref:hypothetical protein n=1 Tax=Acinetobacter junii TaxID=40215 RepID=UPI001BC873F7